MGEKYMTVYTKLSEARKRLRNTAIKKSGKNKFAGFEYFELQDFLHPILDIFDELGLFGNVTFTDSMGTLTIRDIEDNSFVDFTAPMASAEIKGCSPVQNLGGSITYLRRYLWVNALEILESDPSDATTGRKGDAPIVTPKGEPMVSEKRQSELIDLALGLTEIFEEDMDTCYYEYMKITDSEEKTYLWGQLGSKVRSAIKKHATALKEQDNG